MSVNPKVVFSTEAYLSILAETYDFLDRETGGIFVGRVVDETWYVIEVVDPGYSSVVRNYGYFEYDVEYVNHLANLRSRLYRNGLELLGLWHRHPGSLDRFTRTDDETNLLFAKPPSRGALSALVNVDPAFRLSIFLVSVPLSYCRIQDVVVGDSHIPGEINAMKRPDDFFKTPVLRSMEPRPWPEMVRGIRDMARRLLGEAQRPKAPQPNPAQEMVMGMLEAELDDYLENQKDYAYTMRMNGDSMEISMTYTGSDPNCPDVILCTLHPDDNRGRCRINGVDSPYRPGIIRNFIEARMVAGNREEERRQEEHQAESGYAELLGLSEGYNYSDLKKAYRSKVKDYHPDGWLREGNETLTKAATEKMLALREAYEYLLKKHKPEMT